MRRLFAAIALLLAACGAASEDEASYAETAEAVDASEVMEDSSEATADEVADAANGVSHTPNSYSLPTAASSEPRIPSFKLPAPAPSVRANLPRSLFGDPKKVGDIASSLNRALRDNGYEALRFYRTPGGFALITRTERIRDDGRPYPENQRWTFQPAPLLNINELFEDFPGGFLRGLRNADPGRYRVLAFLVTTEAVTTGASAATFQTTQEWLTGGADFLPPSIRNIDLTPNHNASVLIYEFRRASVSSAPEFVNPSAIPARRHLTAARLLQGN